MTRLPDHTPALPVEMATTGTGNEDESVSAIKHTMIVALDEPGVKPAPGHSFPQMTICFGIEARARVLQCESPVNSAYSGRIMAKRPRAKKRGIVEKVIPPPHPSMPEKAQIAVEDADHLYREIRIDNTLVTEDGEKVKLKEQAPVDVVIEADQDATVPKSRK